MKLNPYAHLFSLVDVGLLCDCTFWYEDWAKLSYQAYKLLVVDPSMMASITFRCPTVPVLKVMSKCVYYEATEHILCAQKELNREEGPNLKYATTYYEHALALLTFIDGKCPETDGTWPFTYRDVQWNYARARTAYAIRGDAPSAAWGDSVPWHWESPPWVNKGAFFRPTSLNCDANDEDHAWCYPLLASQRSPLEPTSIGSAELATVRQPLGSTGCVSMLFEVCVENGRLLVQSTSPAPLRLCGEFSTDWLQPVEAEANRPWPLVPFSDGLVIVGGLRHVSTSNLYHLLHAIIPLVWQIWHPSYAPGFPSIFDILGVHSSDYVPGPVAWEEFWWSVVGSPLQSMVSARTKCYTHAMVGREMVRTGLGGSIGRKQVTFFTRAFLRQGQPSAPFTPFAKSDDVVRVLVPLRVNVARRLVDFEVLQTWMQRRGLHAVFQTVDLATEAAETQVWLAQNADILFGVHGMALAYGIFLPRHGEVVELVVPGSAFCLEPMMVNGNPWTLYGGLSRLAGVSHRCVYGGKPLNASQFHESEPYYHSPHEWALRAEISCATLEVLETLVSAIEGVARRKFH
eukprot:GEMP01020193.1.p1 GENE.GEMP01020193.1~~GEMP01020193.1.p1  ORF type:complete len:589 (+),score=118.60 GEMP01020193.1:53-1768(+)